MKLQAGDWVIVKGEGSGVWLVRHVFTEEETKLCQYDEPRFTADFHSGLGVTGANLRIADARIATQRELMASSNFRIGFQRVIAEAGEGLVRAPWAS